MFILFDYTDANGKNDIKEWALGLEKRERAKLNAKLDMLAKPGSDLFPQVLTGTPAPGILKLRVKGKVQLRPMLCKGSIDEKEFTLLIGAKERGSQFVPEKADEKANIRKQIIIENPSRRCSHERIS
ncbi:MAG: hypothetical protein EXR90_00065 [Methyloglobulus sp.]|nr:hypothetical protein [Methyloglobulus sp.]